LQGSKPREGASPLQLGQQRALDGEPAWINRHKLLKRADATPSKTHLPSQVSPPETAKQRMAPANEGEAALSAAETAADERQAQLRAIASELLYWKGGLKVLKQAQLPKWRGCFQVADRGPDRGIAG